jgi:hypothetical protein
MNQLLTTCPVCNGPLHATRLACDNCHTAVEGEFSLGWIGRLNREQMAFVELLLKNRGNVNGVASELKIAYNTARSRLDDIITALGYGVPIEDGRPERRVVLDRVAAGEITVEEAMRMLRS